MGWFSKNKSKPCEHSNTRSEYVTTSKTGGGKFGNQAKTDHILVCKDCGKRYNLSQDTRINPQGEPRRKPYYYESLWK